MGRIKKILKTITTFVFMLLAISELKFIIVYWLLTEITGEWTTLKISDTGFPKICYLHILAYVIILTIVYLSNKFLFENGKIFKIAILSVILLFLNSMFGVFGCFWFCL